MEKPELAVPWPEPLRYTHPNGAAPGTCPWPPQQHSRGSGAEERGTPGRYEDQKSESCPQAGYGASECGLKASSFTYAHAEVDLL